VNKSISEGVNEFIAVGLIIHPLTYSLIHILKSKDIQKIPLIIMNLGKVLLFIKPLKKCLQNTFKINPF